jgi:dTDP-3-amino-3,4,6-trideoxy-alpha-D-glucose transaminase
LTVGDPFRIPLFSAGAELAEIGQEVRAAVERVLASGRYIGGPEVESFEDEFASAIAPGRRAVAVGSGTDALRLALVAMGIGPGDEVVVPVNTFTATAMAVETAGATPVFADVDESTRCLSAATIAAALGARTRAVIPVHLFGHPAPMPEIVELARARDLLVLEDAAQAHGALCHGRPVGSWGDAAAFSFYPSKNLGAYGDGGAVIAGHALAERVRTLRDLGRPAGSGHVVIGFNSRLDALQAAVLRAKLPHLEAWNAARRRLADAYRDRLTELDAPGLRLPDEAPWARHVYHLFVVTVPRRDVVLASMQDDGVEARVHYPAPLHRQPAHRRFVRQADEFPVADSLGGRILSLPLYPQMSEDDVGTVVEALARALDRVSVG